jgi:hypothetical protein
VPLIKKLDGDKMLSKYIRLVPFLLIPIIALVSCSGGEMENNGKFYSRLSDVPKEEWSKLSKIKIYFGHQSVGNNILSGIEDLMEQYPYIKLDIVETTDSKDLSKGVLAHSRVGENNDPRAKLKEFSEILKQGMGKKADITALKFCYLDVEKKTDVSKLFDDYKLSMQVLKKKYPDLKIIHFTAPLTVSKSSWKTTLKKILGKKDFWEFNDNIRRNQYNAMLVKEYEGREPVFDIARIESTRQDGSRQSFELTNETYYSLVPEYTKDGGHLNEVGRKIVAENFILLLINLV